MSGKDRDLLAWLERGRLLAADGAMGTALQMSGLPPGGCPEIWNLERPEAVAAVSRSYLEAGAEILQTNSFGGSPARLAAHGHEDRCAEVNRAASEIARGAAGSHALVAGSIGPTGLLLQPHGPLAPDRALEGFRAQAEALAGGGCDAFAVETMTDLREAILAVRASAATGLPVVACMTFELTPRGVFTIFGDSPQRTATELRDAGAAILGANCGTGPGPMMEIVATLRAATRLPISVRPNAGTPVIQAGLIRYPETPQSMASHVEPLVEAGASIIGGCCGTGPEHVRALAEAVRASRRRSLSRQDRP